MTITKIIAGDRVTHIKEGDVLGTVVSVDDENNYFFENYGVTTCKVVWDDCPNIQDVQWTSKLLKVENE